MDHRNTIVELRAEIKEMRLRVKADKTDSFAAKRAKVLEYYLADKLFFARRNHLRANGKNLTTDMTLQRLSVRLDKALAAL
jgi:hypothetical protein